ncbi:MAG TPA: hypothetical protein VIY54_11175 [Steroidobacteraceae bacterium]
MLKRRSALTVALLASTLLSSGCTTVGSSSDAATGLITIPVRFEDSLGNTLSSDARTVNATVLLRSIPDQIFGNPRVLLLAESIHTTPATFELDLDQLRRIAAKESGRINKVAADSGWKIAPANTRMLRVGTDIQQGAHRIQLFTAFTDSASANVLILAYFDRPCHVAGTIAAHFAGQPSHTYVVNVTVEHAGLNWLAVTEDANQANRVITHASRSVIPVFVVRLGSPDPQTPAVTK